MPSDKDGWAQFVNLTVAGSNSDYMYIFFVVDGRAVMRWGQNYFPLAEQFNLPYYISPIVVDTTVAKVKLINTPSNTTVEGQPLAVQPKIQVLGKLFFY